MSKRTKKEITKRKQAFEIYRAQGGKLNNRGNKIGNGKCIDSTPAGY